jgi:hypothetical protein
MGGWRWEKGGEGAPLFPTDRTPDTFIKSLFGSGIISLRIAAARGFSKAVFEGIIIITDN